MRVVFMGSPAFSVGVLDALIDAGHDIVAVYSQPPRPAGRGHKETPCPVHRRAADLGLAVRTPTTLRQDDAQAAFAALEADVAVVAAYGLILPQAILDMPRLGCLNVHASLLPRWRGAAPIQRAIMEGDDASGVTIMQMEAGLDTGPMLLWEAVPIDAHTTAGALHDTLADLGARLMVETLRRLGDDGSGLTPVPQPADGVTYAAKIDKAEAQIDWAQPAERVARHINGLSPFPGAWFMVDGARIKALQAEVAPGSPDAAPGRLLDGAVRVACADGAVRLTRLQRAGKGPMDADTFLRGMALPAGAVLA